MTNDYERNTENDECNLENSEGGALPSLGSLWHNPEATVAVSGENDGMNLPLCNGGSARSVTHLDTCNEIAISKNLCSGEEGTKLHLSCFRDSLRQRHFSRAPPQSKKEKNTIFNKIKMLRDWTVEGTLTFFNGGSPSCFNHAVNVNVNAENFITASETQKITSSRSVLQEEGCYEEKEIINSIKMIGKAKISSDCLGMALLKYMSSWRSIKEKEIEVEMINDRKKLTGKAKTLPKSYSPPLFIDKSNVYENDNASKDVKKCELAKYRDDKGCDLQEANVRTFPDDDYALTYLSRDTLPCIFEGDERFVMVDGLILLAPETNKTRSIFPEFMRKG